MATIVTGQQIGLLGGPLYTIYKVLGAVYHANEIKGEAVYWLETNDADFNEINHIDYLDNNNQLQTLRWDIPTHGYSTGHIQIDHTLTDLLNQFFDTLRPTEYTEELRQLALDCYQPGTTLAEASVKLAAEILKEIPVKLFTPFDTQYRDFIQPILRKEALRTLNGEQCNCFAMLGAQTPVDENKQRKTLFRQGDQFITRDKQVIDIQKTELVPNVKTRSICQDAYFNAHSYIAGPGEVKYLAQMDDNYAFHGVSKAKVQPRMSIYLLEPKVLRLLDKLDLKLEDIKTNSKDELIKTKITAETGMNFKAAQQEAETFTAEYIARLEKFQPEAKDLKKLRKTLQGEVKQLLGKIRARHKTQMEGVITNISYLSDTLQPFGKPQERIFNIFYYMNLYGGKRLIHNLMEHYQPLRKELAIKPEQKND